MDSILATHLSAPSENSINDFIDPEDFSLQYATTISICHSLGKGLKVDLKNAFRLCPVRQEDWHLLGTYWQGKYFVDHLDSASASIWWLTPWSGTTSRSPTASTT